MNKITKVGIYIIIIAVITPLISYVTNPSGSYVWIILFPIELVIGVAILVIGLIARSISGPKADEPNEPYE